MAAWQFDGTVCYQSGKKVAYTPVSLGTPNGQGVAEIYRTDTDLAGRFQGVLRDGPQASAFFARAFDSWRGRAADWVPVRCNGANAIAADVVLPWDGPEVCNANGQWHSSALPFVEALVRGLEQPGAMQKVLTLRILPVQQDGKLYENYPADPAIDRMFTQFQEEAGQARHPHAAMDIARRISDCLLRMGFAKRFDERIDVFKFALMGILARPNEDRKTHIRNLLKTLSMSLRRPFVPGNGAVVEVESATAAMGMVLFAGAWLSLGRTDLQLKKEVSSSSSTTFLLTVPSGK